MDDYNENNINNINQSPEYFDKENNPERQGYNKPEYSFWAEKVSGYPEFHTYQVQQVSEPEDTRKRKELLGGLWLFS